MRRHKPILPKIYETVVASLSFIYWTHISKGYLKHGKTFISPPSDKTLTTEKTGHLLLIGAGVSSLFGLPTSVEIVKSFQLYLKRAISDGKTRKKEIRKINSLIKLLKLSRWRLDSESLYSCFQGFSKPKYYAADNNVFTAVMLSKIAQRKFRLRQSKIAYNLITEYHEYLLSTFYTQAPTVRRNVIKLYGELFHKITGDAGWKRRNPKRIESNIHLFTTNYDNIIELFGDSINQDIVQFYNETINDRITLNFDNYEHSERGSIFLYKLHGSVDLVQLENGTYLKTEEANEIIESRPDSKVRSRVLVMGLSKNVVSDPHFELLSLLKKRFKEQKKCYVIGYSFRDKWISQVLNDAISSDPGEYEIIYIDRNAVNNVRRNLSEYPNLVKAIKPIKSDAAEYFGVKLH
jgi:hypothetical protein